MDVNIGDHPELDSYESRESKSLLGIEDSASERTASSPPKSKGHVL